MSELTPKQQALLDEVMQQVNLSEDAAVNYHNPYSSIEDPCNAAEQSAKLKAMIEALVRRVPEE